MDDQVASLARTQIKTSPGRAEVEIDSGERGRIYRDRRQCHRFFQALQQVVDDLYLDVLNTGNRSTVIVQDHVPHDCAIQHRGGNELIDGLLLTRAVLLVYYVDASLADLLLRCRQDREGIGDQFVELLRHYLNQLRFSSSSQSAA